MGPAMPVTMASGPPPAMGAAPRPRPAPPRSARAPVLHVLRPRRERQGNRCSGRPPPGPGKAVADRDHLRRRHGVEKPACPCGRPVRTGSDRPAHRANAARSTRSGSLRRRAAQVPARCAKADPVRPPRREKRHHRQDSAPPATTPQSGAVPDPRGSDPPAPCAAPPAPRAEEARRAARRRPGGGGRGSGPSVAGIDGQQHLGPASAPRRDWPAT